MAVSLGIGTTGQAKDRRAKFRLAFHFGVFQTGMTLLGWAAGSTIAVFIAGIDHWVAMALLGYVGFNLIRSGFNPDGTSYSSNPSKGGTLMMLCVATSLDALAVGLSMAMLKTEIIFPALVIGVVASILSTLGLLAGSPWARPLASGWKSWVGSSWSGLGCGWF